jgi:hypothetical protein
MSRSAVVATLLLTVSPPVAVAVQPDYVIGATPRAAALAATAKFAAHEVSTYTNHPDVTYKLGNCQLLFRHPWMAWGCKYGIYGLAPSGPPICDHLRVAVKRLPDGTYRATALGKRDVTREVPCT